MMNTADKYSTDNIADNEMIIAVDYVVNKDYDRAVERIKKALVRLKSTGHVEKYAEYLIGKGQNIGILENDFGAVNVDMMLLQDLMGDNCELEMVSGGCDADCHRRRF